MEKTNLGLRDWAVNALNHGWVYWYGTTCLPCTKDLYTRKKKQYPEHYTSDRTAKYEKHIAEKRMCCDCIGLE